MDAFLWHKSEGQNSWIKIGFSFLVFYFGEAILFWEGGWMLGGSLMKLSFANPYIYPIGYWVLFGICIYFIQSKKSSSQDNDPIAKRFFKWQGIILTTGITIGILALTITVMRVSGNTTLGHTALFFGMFLTAAIIGGMELNIGWLSAALLWLLTTILISNYPATLDLFAVYNDEDIWLGLSFTIGFFLIGGIPYRVNFTKN